MRMSHAPTCNEMLLGRRAYRRSWWDAQAFYMVSTTLAEGSVAMARRADGECNERDALAPIGDESRSLTAALLAVRQLKSRTRKQ